jgi:hypothetical protein
MTCDLIIAMVNDPGPEGMIDTGFGLAMTTALLGMVGSYGRPGVGLVRGRCEVGTGEELMGLLVVIWGPVFGLKRRIVM